MTNKQIQESRLFESLKWVELTNRRKTRLKLLNFGAAVFNLNFEDGNGVSTNICVSPEKPEDFLSQTYYNYNKCFGASVGRYAGRISRGEFNLNGKNYPLYTKRGVHLHGGKFGFPYKFWNIQEVNKSSVTFSYLSKDGEEGYPGNLMTSVRYTLTDKDEVKIDYEARSDKDTIINLTNHTYFNLNGGGSVQDHLLRINANKVLEVDEQLLPTGNLRGVSGSDLDFLAGKSIGDHLLDNVFVLKKEEEVEISLQGSRSGIHLEINTDQPAVVVYVPENLPDAWNYQTEVAPRQPSICLETQNFPDSPHHPNFPSSVLKEGQVYRNSTCWRFKRDKEF